MTRRANHQTYFGSPAQTRPGWSGRRISVLSLLPCLALFGGVLVAPPAYATRLGDLCEVQGVRGNVLKGVGIVVGLAGTGDKVAEAVRAQQRMLERLNIEVDNLGNIKSDNAAVVIATGVFPPFAKEGTRIDVQVSSLYDCESLEGGILLNTQLTGDDGRVYAVAQGPVSTGGFNADAGGANVRQNHVTVGRVPMGAYIEREIPSTITDGERITLLLKRPDFMTASNIEQVLNDSLGPRSATALGAGAINVKIPLADQDGLVSFIARLKNLPVESALPSRVVLNERTGTIVVGGEVSVKPCQVAHGNITIEIAKSPVFPPPPLVGQEEREGEVTDLTVKQDQVYLMPVQGTSAAEVAMALNKLKITSRDMIAIFQALREAGALDADLEIM